MRISGLLYRVMVCLVIFSAYALAQTVAVAHIIYEGNVLYYADNESNFVYKAVEKNSDGTFTIEFTNERLANGKKDVRRLQFGVGCNGNTCHTDLSPDNKPLLGELFPGYKENVTDAANIEKQVVWIVINEDKTLTISDTKPVVAVKPKKHIRFLTPWTNTNAIMFLNDSENYMHAVSSPYCGWFEAEVSKPSTANVYFKQTIGSTFVGSDGTTEDETTVTPINLDSAIALSDTIWVVAYQYGAPEVHTNYPGVLGECLPKILPVMMFDWYDGSMNSDGSKNGLSYGDGGAGRTGFDVRGVPMFGIGTSEDFGPDGCKGTPMTGMVEKQLGPNGVPVRAKNFPESSCTNATHLNNWFLPEVLYNDGVNTYTNVTCRDLELTLTDDGFWLGQKDDESPEGGLFLLDDFRWLDSAQTIENPHYDSLSGGDDIPGYHNYGFTMKIQAEFVYVKGQYFEFNGDDDVWVFINNKLVVDIGGQHKKVRKAVNLDTLNLTPGETYPFHIFYAERKRTQSNFMMRTSIDLKVESSMFLTDHSTDSTLIKKEVWQNIREKTLACDFSSNSETKRTERGPSNFTLFGKSLPMTGVALSKLDTAYYSGITITNDFTMLTINTTNISRMQTLPPGTYYVRVSLKNNPKEYKDVYFTIPPTELPNIAFADIIDSSYCFIADVIKQDTLCLDKYWKPLGNEISRDISSDTLPINMNSAEKLWAGRIYPINVSFVEEWARSYSGMAIQVSTNDAKLIPCDSLGNPLPNNEFVLIEGKNTFFVKATGAVTNGTITISTSVAKNKSVNWTNINIAEPPVPQIETAYIYDRNGDGRGDSVWVSFNKPLGGNSVLNTITFTFGYTHYELANVVYAEGARELSIVADGDGFSSSISTGGATEPYSGKITAQYTYTNPEDFTVSNFSVNGLLGDAIGPIIMAAEISYTADGKTMLTLTFSEGLNTLNANSDLFSYRSYGSGSLSTFVQEADYLATAPANRWKLIFSKKTISDIIPIVGDSIRIKPPSEGGLALDLVGIPAHDLNPWVRITGEQRITVTSPPVVTMDKNSPNFELTKEIVRSDSATVPILVQSDKPLTATQVGEIYGTQGHYLGDMNMSELVENEISEIAKVVKTSTVYTDKDAVKNGSPSTTVTLETIIGMMERNEISPKDAKERFGVSQVIINAYNNGLLTKENLNNYMHGTDDDIKTIAESMADKTELSYKTIYFSSLGQFVNSDEGKIACNDNIFKTDGSQNCLGNEGHLYLAWNMRSHKGRLAGTGVYIARLEIRLIVNGKRITKRTQDFLWGFRHGKLAIADFGLQ